MIWLSLHNIVVVPEVVIDVGDPCTLLLHYILGSGSIFNLPLVFELADKAKLCGNWWNTEFAQSPIVLVSSDGDTHYLLRGTFKSACWELSICFDVFKDWKDAWSSLVNVIFLTTIERVDESISIAVSIDNKVQLIFVLGQEIFVS